MCGPAESGAIPGVVSDRRFAGSAYVYAVKVEGGELEVQTTGDVARPGESVGLRPVAAPAGIFAFPRRPGGDEG